MRAEGIGACVEPAIDFDSNRRILSLAQAYPGFIFPAAGVHPTRTFQSRVLCADGTSIEKRLRWRQRKQIRLYARDPSVRAIGETGLDYHQERKEQHRLRQKIWFIWQLKLAHKEGLPVILHIREADRDAIRILRRYRKYLHGGVCHCFSGSAAEAGQYTALGLKIGIGGALLKDSPKKAALEQAVIQTPLDQILLETDGPYVRPECPGIPKKQLKKARNTSLILPAVIRRIAALKGVSPEEAERVTSAGAARLFNLPAGD